MDQEHQGNLANLWVVGGRQTNRKLVVGEKFFYKFCPECGWHLTGKFSTCPRCGADLRLRECPYYRGVIPVDLKICPSCTGPIG